MKRFKLKNTWMYVLFFLNVVALNGHAAIKTPYVEDIRYIPGEQYPALVVYLKGKAPKTIIQEKENGKQVIISFKGLDFPAALTRRIDTSSVPGPVLQITPYNVGSDDREAKLVLQLRKAVKVSKKWSKGELRFDLKLSRKKAATKKKRSWRSKVAKRSSKKAKDTLTTKAAQRAGESGNSVDIANQLIDTLSLPVEERVYRGTKVSIEASNVRVHDVFRLVSAASNLNIITASNVTGNVDLSLKDVPWDQVLDIVLGMQQLRATAVGNVIRITTLADYTAEQQALFDLQLAEQKAEPVIMSIIPVNYAKAEDVRTSISALLIGAIGNEETEAADAAQATAALTGTPGAATTTNIATASSPEESLQAFARGRIEVDERTNSLLVTHTAKQIDRIRQLVRELDVPTPQVLIESKIMTADETFTRSLGVTWGGVFRNDTAGQSGSGGFAVGSFDTDNVSEFSVSGPAQGGLLRFKLGGGATDALDFTLNLAESRGQTKLMAAPRIIVNNKQQASITDGQKIAVQTVDQQGEGAANITTSFVDALLSLSVTPQVTNSGFVLMDLTVNQDVPTGGGPGTERDIESKSVQTQVLVESGSTIILGGVYSYNQGNDVSGIPILMDLPFLGKLFRSTTENLDRSELLIFVTPRVLDIAIRAEDENEELGEGDVTL